MYVKQVAVTLETSMGRSEAMLKSTISTSSVNTSPAIGALKIPAIAAAAPHPTSSIKVLLSILNSLPRLEPMAEPVRTIGASAPTEPPKPMVMAEAMTEVQQLCPLRRDRFDAIAYRIRVIPCEMLSLTTYFTKSEVRKIPMTGNMRKSQFEVSACSLETRISCISSIIECRTSAASDANNPMKNARISVICRFVTCFVRHSLSWSIVLSLIDNVIFIAFFVSDTILSSGFSHYVILFVKALQGATSIFL